MVSGAKRGGVGFVDSHLSHDEAVRRMGHPYFWESGEKLVGFVDSHPSHDEAVRRMGHPYFWESGEKLVGLVVSHPKRDEAALRMGHPHSCGVKSGGVRFDVSQVFKCEGPGAPRFLWVGKGAAAGGQS